MSFLLRKLLSWFNRHWHLRLLLQCSAQRHSPLLPLCRALSNRLVFSPIPGFILCHDLRSSLHSQEAQKDK